ncbi:MAG: DUF362 domain-containing protein [Polyangia bacterium]|jgi:uncharacterized protein (DUF362 family)
MKLISRRTFVGGSLVAAATLRYGRALAVGEPDLVDVSGSDPAKMVAAALAALGGMAKFVNKGDFVVIKPNAAFANPPAWGTTTHPATVVAVAKACLEAKAKEVLILEFPQAKGEKCLERCGLTAALAAVPAVKVKLLGPGDFQKVEVKGGVTLKSVEVAKQLLSADVFINVPAAKAHFQAGVSFGLKNHMGLIWDRQAFHTAMELHQAVADLGRVIKPTLTILDATRALLTNGPAGPGDTAEPGRMVAGRKVASVDAYGLTLAKFNSRIMTPADARHIEFAGKAGLGEVDVARMKVKKVAA